MTNMTKKNKIGLTIFLVLAVVVVVLAILAATGVFKQSSTGGGSGPVATVNGEDIKRDEYQAILMQMQQAPGQSGKEVSEQRKQQILKQLINQELVYQAATDEGISASKKEIEKRYQEAVSRIGSEEKFQKQLEENDITKQEVKNRIERQIVMQKYRDQLKEENDITVTEQDVKDFYDNNLGSQEQAPPFEQLKEQLRSQLERKELQGVLQKKTSELRKNADIQKSL